MATLLLLFIALPAVELALLIELGQRIGTLETLALIVGTGVVGASLARRQGLAVVAQVQREVAEGRLPASSLVDGLLILLASALLVTPGVLTDAFGFACLTPVFRRMLKEALRRRFERAIAEQRLEVHLEGIRLDPEDLAGLRGAGAPRSPFGRGPVIDVEPADRDDDRRTDHEP